MKYLKNTIIDLWNAFGKVPVDDSGDVIVIDQPEGFLGWADGTNVEDIWHWFDEAYEAYGGVAALMYEPQQIERRFSVQTPDGIIECYAKHEGKDCAEDYPGVYIDLRRTKDQLADKQIGDLACCVEYDSCAQVLQTVVYKPGFDEPQCIEVYEPLQTFAEFVDKHAYDIVMMDVYDANGDAIPDYVVIPNDTRVIDYSSRSGYYDITVDFHVDIPERIPVEDVRRGLTEGDIIPAEEDGEVVAKIGDYWFHFDACNSDSLIFIEDNH